MEYYLKTTEEMGRGLYALYDLPKGRLLFTAELLVLSEKDTTTVNETDLKHYTFKYNDKQDCLVLGDGEIFNHGACPNIGYLIKEYDNRKAMFFYTLSDIKQNEQLTIDYNADTRVAIEDYKVNLFETLRA